MSLSPDSRLGPYQVLSKLGAGGMGEVYRARDTKLSRDVALKVLPASFTTDPDRLARFKREAVVLASLNHPNIASVYGFEDSESTHALVMELVEGDDLSTLIRRAAFSVTDAIPIARQLAEALEAAHENGIIHRDLKPANIKVRGDGTVKVLDFGLAKIVAEVTGRGGGGGAERAEGTEATMTSPAMTQMGMIIGTAAYMAPEQAKGKPVDKRADIWAFGVVLYEMLTGRRAFDGEDVSTTLAAVLMRDPEWTALPAETPPALRTLILRCLERDPKARLRDIGEARLLLSDPERLRAQAASTAASGSPTTTRASRLPWLAAGLAGGIVLGIIGWQLVGRRTPTASEAPTTGRFQLTLPADVELTTGSGGFLGVSPDGRTLVFMARKTGGPAQLWLRTLDSTSVKPLPGTDGGTLPFWSPDGEHLGFFADNKLKRLDLRTGAVTTLADAANPGGGTWNAEDTIVYSPMIEGPLFRISAGGGAPAQLTTLDEKELEANHMWPHFLPDGRHYLFQVLGLNNRGIYAGTLDGPSRTLVIRQDGFDMTAAQYSSSGHIVYVRNHQLVARPFDADRMTVTGDEVALADGFGIGGPGRPMFGISRTGVLAFRPLAEGTVFQPTWFSRAGKQETALGPPGPYSSLELSPDGRTLAMDRFTEQESSIWLLDVERGTSERFTSGAYTAGPVWFPKGDRLAYSAVRDTPPNPFASTLAGLETRLARMPKAIFLGSVTSDETTIIGQLTEAGTDEDLWLFPTAPNGTPTVFLRTPFSEADPQLSPDDRWVAFSSDESGEREVYLTTFPKAGRRYRVSTNGGGSLRWSTDGKEILFRSGQRLLAATFAVSAGGEPVIGTPRILMTLPEGAAGSWAMAPNGQRFLFNIRVTPRQVASMTIVVNWPALAR